MNEAHLSSNRAQRLGSADSPPLRFGERLNPIVGGSPPIASSGRGVQPNLLVNGLGVDTLALRF